MKTIVRRLTVILLTLSFFSIVLASVSRARVKETDKRIERSGSVVEKTEQTSSTVLPAQVPTGSEAAISGIEGPTEVVSTTGEPSLRSPQAGNAIHWSCVSSGGGSSASGNFNLSGTIGQTAAGPVASGSYINHQGFWQYFQEVAAHCCIGGSVSDVNCSGTIDITDIQVMVDHLFLSLEPLCCEEEGNINYPGSGLPGESEVTDITDLQWMVDNQFLTLEPLPPCP